VTIAWVGLAWRALRTGLAFFIFGAGALVLAFGVFPLVRLLPGAPDRRQLRAQYLVHLTFRVFVAIMRALGLIRVCGVGTERLGVPGARLVVANHPTLIDVVLLIACMPQADCVVKQAYWRSRIMRRVVAAAGYIPNVDGEDLVRACVTRLAAGRALLLFPEGTRSPRNGLGPFRRGVAHVALRSGCDPIPVVITCDPPTLMKGTKWYDVPDRTAVLRVEVGPPIAIRDVAGDSGDEPLAARRMTAALVAFYQDQLGGGRVRRAHA
jgi:1-acyl-sn-glycerol-3-phosphate acyltransferase